MNNVFVVVVIVVVVVLLVVIGSSHRTPVKFGAQEQKKPPSDVVEHVPPLKQLNIVHGLGVVVVVVMGTSTTKDEERLEH